jgi:hypothetical protein
MSRHLSIPILCLALACVLSLRSSARGGDRLDRWLADLRGEPIPAASQKCEPKAGVSAPMFNHSPNTQTAMGVSAYRYGYFGAKQHKQCSGPFSGYFYDYTEYSFRRAD